MIFGLREVLDQVDDPVGGIEQGVVAGVDLFGQDLQAVTQRPDLVQVEHRLLVLGGNVVVLLRRRLDLDGVVGGEDRLQPLLDARRRRHDDHARRAVRERQSGGERGVLQDVGVRPCCDLVEDRDVHGHATRAVRVLRTDEAQLSAVVEHDQAGRVVDRLDPLTLAADRAEAVDEGTDEGVDAVAEGGADEEQLGLRDPRDAAVFGQVVFLVRQGHHEVAESVGLAATTAAQVDQRAVAEVTPRRRHEVRLHAPDDRTHLALHVLDEQLLLFLVEWECLDLLQRQVVLADLELLVVGAHDWSSTNS